MAVRTSTNSVSLAIDEWSLVLGKDKVSSEKEILARYARTTQADAPSPSCILYPTTTEEVQAVVRIASKYDVVVYPISRGKNWGYGDMCAPTDGSAIIEFVLPTRWLPGWFRVRRYSFVLLLGFFLFFRSSLDPIFEWAVDLWRAQQ